ncbi:MAG TPA: 4Fe-4S binding protein [Prolixibacteraceae bacterium]|nr:4Fe-4S binding protein [Prolixibacteraceae bacterium]
MEKQSGWHYDLTNIPFVLRIIRNRSLLFTIRAILLAGFIFSIVAGIFGSPVGSHNFAIIFVWIAWWTALKLFFIPIGGRSWCTICPIPMPGEWIQQGALVTNPESIRKRHRWWPRLKGTWLQTAGFFLIGLFGAVTLTQPAVTAWVFAGLILIATLTSVFFEKRSFCRYLCPMGGYIGWYALLAPLELRVRDRSICSTHREKDCIHGNENGCGCQWMVSPISLKDNSRCGLCMDCIRTCTKSNVSLNIRPFGSDLARLPQRMDDAILGSVLLANVAAFSAVFLGHWGELKQAAYTIGSADWWLYAGALLIWTLLIVPGGLYMAALISRHLSGIKGSTRKLFISFSYTLIPLGFAAWLAFTISFALAKITYIIPVLSDPFGFGWNLFGGANFTWLPLFPSLVTPLVVIILLSGFTWSLSLAWNQNGYLKRKVRTFLPYSGFAATFTTMMLFLLVR